jgi:hypothetical protein
VFRANAGVKRLCAIFSGQSPHRGQSCVPCALRLWALGAAMAGLAASGCGTPATLHITAPSNAMAGLPFSVTVTATIGQSPDRAINSPVQFTSSDRAAALPPIYYFTANDAGSHTFTNGVTLMTDGSQSVTATIIGASALNATANLTVSATSTAAQSKASAP